jgi:formate/nitrite transporter FocA (FNT family)
VPTDNSWDFGVAGSPAGLAFTLGLVMLVLAGGEVFTSNNLMVLACTSRRASGRPCCAPARSVQSDFATQRSL